MAACSYGLGKNALAAWLSWWSVKTNGGLGGLPELRAEHSPHVELIFEPQRHGHAETAEACGGVVEIGLDQAVELGQRLVVEGDVVEIRRWSGRPPRDSRRWRGPGRPGSCLTRVNRSSWAAATISPIDDQCRGTVVIERRNPEDGGHASSRLQAEPGFSSRKFGSQVSLLTGFSHIWG